MSLTSYDGAWYVTVHVGLIQVLILSILEVLDEKVKTIYFYCKGKSIVDSLKCLGVFRRYGMVLDKTEWMLSEVSDPGDVS